MYITDAIIYSNYNPIRLHVGVGRVGGGLSSTRAPQAKYLSRIHSPETAKNTEFVWKFVVEGEQESR
ncbi:hypothetical protein OH492_11760 [Vibrio chagasii]|nr:hypothetical protein [Vibrio chagasii]